MITPTPVCTGRASGGVEGNTKCIPGEEQRALGSWGSEQNAWAKGEAVLRRWARRGPHSGLRSRGRCPPGREPINQAFNLWKEKRWRRFLPLNCTHTKKRDSARAGNGEMTSPLTGSRQREWTRNWTRLWTRKACSRWRTSSSKAYQPPKPHQLGIQYSISRVDGGHQHPHPLSYVTATSYFSGCFFVWHRVPSSTGELWWPWTSDIIPFINQELDAKCLAY